MINVETGDSGRLVRGECGCRLGTAGLDTRFHQIRSDDKFTSEGIAYPAADLLELVESFLSSRFGGRPTDDQLAESEQRGIPVVHVRVNPTIDGVVEPSMLDAMYDWLESRCGQHEMLRFWRDARTLRIVRERPSSTDRTKFLP